MESKLIKMVKRLLPLGDFTVRLDSGSDESIVCDSEGGTIRFWLWENQDGCDCLIDMVEVSKQWVHT